MESTGLSISVIVIVVKMVEVGKEERGTKSKLTLLLPSHHSSARKIVSGKVAGEGQLWTQAFLCKFLEFYVLYD